MTGYPEAIGLLVDLLHHLEGKIDVDTLLLKSLAAPSGDIKHLDDGFTVIEMVIELRAVHKADRVAFRCFRAIEISSFSGLLELQLVMGLGFLDKYQAGSSQWLLQSWQSHYGFAANWWLLRPRWR